MQTINKSIEDFEKELSPTWQRFESIRNQNQERMLAAFTDAQIQNSHYTWVTGYGYDDLGKDKIDEVYANYFNTEAALVRPQLVSGTHAIASAVMGNLKSGEEFVAVSGKPYDTLQTVFKNYVEKYNLKYAEGIENLKTTTKLAFIQRSRGYEWRDSLSLSQLETLIQEVKKVNPEIIVFVDNCYGEFTQLNEPTDLGADLIAGSLIKNPGGGIVAAGAYIAGKKNLVEAAADFATAPGIGVHGGCMFDQTRLFLQGFFNGPAVVCEALKSMSLAAATLSELGYETIPAAGAERNDIIQATKLNDREALISFCKLVQQYSPVNSMFSPIPDQISGYDDEVIMAAGTFIEGSSIELSADGPLREPYIAYLQGGINYAHSRIFIRNLFQHLSSLK